jgi:hypothetical protein
MLAGSPNTEGGARRKMPLTLTEFASRWKLTLTRAIIWISKGPIEMDIIQGTEGYIYADSRYGLVYAARSENGLSLSSSRRVRFDPRGYPGEVEAFDTQRILTETLGIYPWGVPRLSVEEYERAIGA